MELISKNCEKKLRNWIEAEKEGKIEDGPLAILDNLHYLAKKVTGPDGNEKVFIDTKVKQMVFHMLCPNGRISKSTVVIKDVWAEVTMSVYENKDDQYPVGTYTSIGIYESILNPISNNEKMKAAIEMATGAALTRALTRMGIGIEFFTDFDLEESFDVNSEFQQELDSKQQQQEEQLETVLTTPTFVTTESEDNQEKTENPDESNVEVKSTELVTEECEPISNTVESQEAVEEKKTEVQEVTESKPKKKGRKKATEDSVIEEQMSFDETEEKEMTLEEAYETKVDFAKYKGKTLKEIVELGDKRWIWLLYPKAPSASVWKAIEIVVADLCRTDAEFKEYVDLRPYKKRKE